MSLSSILNIANSALNAADAGLSVTSNNIANANTTGYDRQDVVLSISSPVNTGNGYMGTGVTVGGIENSSNQFIQAQLLDQEQTAGKSNAMNQTLSTVEQVFNEAQNLGLSTSLTQYINDWNDVASDPTSQTPRTVLLQDAGTLVSTAQDMENSILQTLNQTNSEIDNDVNQINTLASQIATLNGQIAQVGAGNIDTQASDLTDQRDQLMSQLSNLVGNASYQDQNGTLTVTIGQMNLLSGTSTNTLSATQDQNGNTQLTLDNTNITSQVNSGQIGGLLAAGSEIQSNSLFGLRKLIASITQQTNLLQESGYGLDESTNNNFFNPLQLSTVNNSASANITASITNLSQVTLDEYTIGFAGGNYTVTDNQTGAVAATGAYISGNAINFDGIQITITGAVTAADSFTVSPLTDAIKNFGVAITDPNEVAAASTLAALPGDNTNALQIAQESSTAAIANLGNSTFSEYYAGLVSGIGSLSQNASDSSTFDQNLLTQIQNQQSSVSGVSLDEESANLVKYQQAYEAASQIIEVTEQLLQTLNDLTLT